MRRTRDDATHRWRCAEEHTARAVRPFRQRRRATVERRIVRLGGSVGKIAPEESVRIGGAIDGWQVGGATLESTCDAPTRVAALLTHSVRSSSFRWA